MLWSFLHPFASRVSEINHRIQYATISEQDTLEVIELMRTFFKDLCSLQSVEHSCWDFRREIDSFREYSLTPLSLSIIYRVDPILHDFWCKQYEAHLEYLKQRSI